VVVVDDPGQHAGVEADAAVTATPGCVLAVQVADCAPVALVSDTVVAVAHAGWRGLVADVLPATVAEMRALGAGAISAVVGPCIHAECYEFGSADLFALASRFGASISATTSWGAPALDLPAAVRAALAAEDVTVIDVATPCTACDDRFWSHRGRGDRQRHGMAVWLEASAA